jgi:proton-translocating NADH-quinone oxidoreductase chain N
MSEIFLLMPFAVLLVLNALPRSTRGAASVVSIVVLVGQMVVAILHVFRLLDWSVFAPIEKTLGFPLAVDDLGTLLLVCGGLAGISALLVGRLTMKNVEDTFTFVNLVLICLVGINGLAMARDLFTLYVFIEVSAVSTFILISMGSGRDAFEGVWKYILLSFVASIFMLTGVAFFLLSAQGISFEEVAASLATPGPLGVLALALFFCGLFVKGALVPFHGWLADAYTTAPTPVSVFMAGIVTKASGIFAIMRVAVLTRGAVPASNEILLAAGAATILVGAFLALGQNDMKRMLAYSSISQMGYIVLALGGEPRLGIIAAAVHFLNHSVSKAGLFSNAAAIQERLGTMDMDRMGGIGQRMPWTAGTAAVASLSLAGLPPLAGFWSKLIIVISLWAAGRKAYAAIAVLASLVTLAYFLVLQRKIFFGAVKEEWKAVREARSGLVLPAVLMAALTVGIGIGFPFVLSALLGVTQ